MKAHDDVVTKTRELDEKMKLLEGIETTISEQEKIHEELCNKFHKRKRKFDEISVSVSQACENQLVLGTPVKAEMLD